MADAGGDGRRWGKGFLCGVTAQMSKARLIGAGAGGTGYGVLTSRDQGGGNKKQGLVSTTNSRVDLSSFIRVRGGGHNRNWIFCMNQLGGVGRRWGQASGPGNRGGVSANCQRLAYRRRQQYPPKPCGAQTRGWGAGVKYPSLCRPEPGLSGPATAVSMNVWAMGIGTKNYSGPVHLMHPYFFYQGLKDKNQIGLHCPPGVQFVGDDEDPVTVIGHGLSLDMEINAMPNGGSATQPCPNCTADSWNITAIRLPLDRPNPTTLAPMSNLWKEVTQYDGINGQGSSPLVPKSGEVYTGLSMAETGLVHPHRYSADTSLGPARGYSYYGRVWRLWGQAVQPFNFGQYGSPSGFITTVTNKIGPDSPDNHTGRYNMNQACPPTLALDACLEKQDTPCSPYNYAQTAYSVELWGSLEGGSGVWSNFQLLDPGNSFPRYLANSTSLCYTNQTLNPDSQLSGQVLGNLLISHTLLYDPNLGLLYAADGDAGAPLAEENTGWVGYSFNCVDGTVPDASTLSIPFPVDTFPAPSGSPVDANLGAPAPPSLPKGPALDAADQYPIMESTAQSYIDDDGVYMEFTQAQSYQSGWIQLPTCVRYDDSVPTSPSWQRASDCAPAPAPEPASPADVFVHPGLLVQGYPGYVPVVLPPAPPAGCCTGCTLGTTGDCEVIGGGVCVDRDPATGKCPPGGYTDCCPGAPPPGPPALPASTLVCPLPLRLHQMECRGHESSAVRAVTMKSTTNTSDSWTSPHSGSCGTQTTRQPPA